MDLHVSVCTAGSVHPVPPVVTDPVWVSRSPQDVQRAVCLPVPALPSAGSGIPADLCGADQQFATCLPLHRHHGAGRCQGKATSNLIPFDRHKAVIANMTTFLFFSISGASDDESSLLCQGERTKSSKLG